MIPIDDIAAYRAAMRDGAAPPKRVGAMLAQTAPDETDTCRDAFAPVIDAILACLRGVIDNRAMPRPDREAAMRVCLDDLSALTSLYVGADDHAIQLASITAAISEILAALNAPGGP